MPRDFSQSEAIHAAANKLMPGGVNSPVRAYKSVGRSPITIDHSAGCNVFDVDGNQYIDYVGSYGPMIVGHAHPDVVYATCAAAQKGASFGMPSKGESDLAQMVIDAVPSVECIRFVNSGTEATMSAIRLARGATSRDKIVKCIGGYHGHADGLLVQAGSGATTLGVPSSPGVPASIVSQTLLVDYNDTDALSNLFTQHQNEIACVILEPVAGNMGCVPPTEGYLQAVRDLCAQNGTILIFDEVMTGFRVAYGGAQQRFNITPDLTCLGKVVGGGLPCAAYGGKSQLMNQVAPAGPIYQAGTLSGNPLAMASGIATLKLLQQNGAYQQLETLSAKLEAGLLSAAKSANLPITINRVGSMLTVFFSPNPVKNYTDATACNTSQFTTFFNVMLNEGITLPPSQFEAWFVSLAHTDQAIDNTIQAAAKAFAACI